MTIHFGWPNSTRTFPAIFVLLKNKKKATYRRMFEQVGIFDRVPMVSMALFLDPCNYAWTRAGALLLRF